MGNFRLTKSFKKGAFAVSAENPQLLYTASLAGNTPYAVVGSAGLSGGLLNQTISACSPSTSIVNYTNQTESTPLATRSTLRFRSTRRSTPAPTWPTSPSTRLRTCWSRPRSIPASVTMKSSASRASSTRPSIPAKPPTATSTAALPTSSTGLTVAPALTTAGAYLQQRRLGGVGGSARVPDHCQQTHLRRQGSVRARRRPLRRLHAVRRHFQLQWRIWWPFTTSPAC